MEGEHGGINKDEWIKLDQNCTKLHRSAPEKKNPSMLSNKKPPDMAVFAGIIPVYSAPAEGLEPPTY